MKKLRGRTGKALRPGGSLSAWSLLGASAVLLALMLSPQGRAFSPLVQLGVLAAADLALGLGLVRLGSRLAIHLSWLSLTVLVYRIGRLARPERPPVLKGKTIAVFGASGGLGAALLAELTHRDVAVVAVTRGSDVTVPHRPLAGQVEIDLESPASIERGVQALPDLDAAVFVTGIDVRKPFADHTEDDVARLLRINLEGPMLATRQLIGRIRDGGIIAHVGGFADGRLALPYYTVDVASRAGLAAFSEALNRELKLEGRDIVISYLCPEPADTSAERPFLDLWRSMGSNITTPAAVARFIADALESRPRARIMGWTSWVIAKINALAPTAADAIALGRIGRRLREVFGSPAPRSPMSHSK